MNQTEIDQAAHAISTQYAKAEKTQMVFQHIFKSAITAIRSNTDESYLDLMEEIEKVNTAQMALIDLSDAYCSKGCSLCCSRTVMMTIPEAIRLWNYTKKLPEPRKTEVLKKAAARYALSSKLQPQEFNHFDFKCPHLQDDGACGAYEDRPIICRNYYSRDLKICKTPVGLPAAEYQKNVLQEPGKIGLFLQRAFVEAWNFAGLPAQIMTIEKTIIIGTEAAKLNKDFIVYLLQDSI